MTRIAIIVKEKRARLAKSVRYVCGNSDYVASFTFDEEWARFPIKTARFQRGEQYTDVVFEGTECPVPVFLDGTSMEIGVYSGADAETAVLYSTTSAWVGMDKSVRSRSGTQEMPGVYDQIVALLNNTADTTIGARDEVMQVVEEINAAVETAAGYASRMQSSVERAEIAAELAEDAKSEAQTASTEALRAKTETEILKESTEAACAITGEAKVEAVVAARDTETFKEEAVAAQSGAEAARAYAEAAAESAENTLASAMKSSVYDPQGYQENIYSYVDMRLGRKVYGVLWDKVKAKCTRLFDAANITLDTTNFGHFGSVNPSYDNPFDSIYPWSERRLCNYSLAAFIEISDTDGYDVRDAVVAWEGEAGFSYDPAPGIGVGVYTPRFWHTSYDTDEGRVFAVSGTKVLGWNEAEATIGGRWFGTVEEMEINGETKMVLGCRPGVPAADVALSDIHEYANNGGMTIEDVYVYDATTILFIVEYATMNTQNAVGYGCVTITRKENDMILNEANNTNTVKILKSAAADCCIAGAIMDIGTHKGLRNVANRLILSVETDAADSTILNVTISGNPISVTTDHFWSIHGLGNMEDAAIGSHSGYIGMNGKCNAYYRGQVMHGNLWRYVRGAYQQANTGHLWITNRRKDSEACGGLTPAHYIDTGIVIPAVQGYIKTLMDVPGFSVPILTAEKGGNSGSPVGDYCFQLGPMANDTILCAGGSQNGLNCGRFYMRWDYRDISAYYGISAVPFSKSNKREV